MNHIIVNIKAPPCGGKSTIAYIIQKALKDHGLIAIIEQNDVLTDYMKKTLDQRLNTIKARTAPIKINMTSTKRGEKS